MKPKTAAIIILSMLLAVVFLQNTNVVTIRFLFWRMAMSQVILLPIIFFIGGVIGFLIGRKSWDW